MSIENIWGKPVMLLHCPGKTKKIHHDKLMELVENQPIILPENVSIVSIITSDILQEAPLHLQCIKSGINYYNSDLANQGVWMNRKKPKCVVDALNKVTTEYSLVLDGNDVVFCGDASNILKPYSSYGRDIIYNAIINRFPDIHIETLAGCPEDKERPILFGPFCNLNAGMCIGKTETLKQFYTELIDIIAATNIPSEQYHVRKLWDTWQDRVFMDYDCKIFQVTNYCTTFSKEDSNRIVIAR